MSCTLLLMLLTLLKRLDSRLRSQVFAQLDDEQRVMQWQTNDDAMAAELIGGLNEGSIPVSCPRWIQTMQQSLSQLSYDRAEKLLRLMASRSSAAIVA